MNTIQDVLAIEDDEERYDAEIALLNKAGDAVDAATTPEDRARALKDLEALCEPFGRMADAFYD